MEPIGHKEGDCHWGMAVVVFLYACIGRRYAGPESCRLDRMGVISASEAVSVSPRLHEYQRGQ